MEKNEKYTIDFRYEVYGEQEIYADSEEEAIKKFKYQSFLEVVENSGAFCDADEMDIDGVYEEDE